MKVNDNNTSSYFKHLLVDPRPLIEEARTHVQDYYVVVTGVSGLLIGPMLTYANNNPLCIVRKRGDNSHSMYVVENGPTGPWVFVDDLIDSGATFKRVYRELYNIGAHRNFKGVHLYAPVYPHSENFYSAKEFLNKVYGCKTLRTFEATL